jgi:hypothetical protein
MWNARTIDSRTVEITNKELLNQWIDKYGIDSDFCRVRILGQEPVSSTNQYIPQDLINAAKGRHIPPESYNFAPVIITCDPAWNGGDATTIYKRQGLASSKLWSTPKNNNDALIAQKIAQYEDQYKADAVFIDLGYGTGIYSFGQQMGRNWQLISFGGKSSKEGFLNKRAEMYGDLLNFLEAGGALPPDDRLCEELSWIETVPRIDGKIQLIDKQDMEASPNDADALALTFAMPVLKRGLQTAMQNVNKNNLEFANGDYDIFAN